MSTAAAGTPGTIGDMPDGGPIDYDLSQEPELVAVLAGGPEPANICVGKQEDGSYTCWIADPGIPVSSLHARRAGPRYLHISDGQVIAAEWSLGKWNIARERHAQLVANPAAERIYRELVEHTSLMAPIRSGDPRAYIEAMIDAALTLAETTP